MHTRIEEMPVAEPMVPTRAIVDRRIRETDDTFTLEIRSLKGLDFSFLPGQFNMLYAFGAGEVPISISGDPSDPDKLVHTIRVVGKVTEGLDALRKGDVLGIRGPFGKPWPVEEAEGRDIVIIAGGIGLAPLRPVIYHVLTNRMRFNRVVILYGARSPKDILYPKDLGSWSSHLDVDVFATVDRATREWRGSVGVITDLIRPAPFDPHSVRAFVCGPEIMMTYAVQHLRARGVHPDRIFISMERNMKCGIGRCGHCQYGASFVCKDGPVFRYDEIDRRYRVREI
jgi:NAD(P)H-flavin reductase